MMSRRKIIAGVVVALVAVLAAPLLFPPTQEVPPPIKAAVLQMAADMYAARETFMPGNVSAVPSTASVESLIGPYRVRSL
mgnify:CR=1 FL=1